MAGLGQGDQLIRPAQLKRAGGLTALVNPLVSTTISEGIGSEALDGAGRD